MQEKNLSRNSPCCLPQKILLWFFGPIPWLISSKIAPRFTAKSCCALSVGKNKMFDCFFWQEHGSKSLSLTTLVECLLLLHWDGNFYWKMAAMFFRCSPQWDQVLFSAKGRQNPSLFVGEKFLCWRAITSWSFFAFLHLLAGNSNLKIFIPRENSRKVQPCCPKRLLVWANAWWAAFKGKTISKMPYARRIQDHFLDHVLQLGVYLQLASGILFIKEGQTILELIDDWIRSHNCHEKACHQKRFHALTNSSQLCLLLCFWFLVWQAEGRSPF